MAPATLDARFELLEPLDDFGDGEAWSARDLQVRNRLVTVKLVAPDAVRAPRDETLRAVKALRHGAVLPLLHHGAVDGRVYLVYERFEAPSLATWLGRVRRGDDQPSRVTLERVAERLCEALDAAHAQTPPITHGALTPRSVLLRATPQGVDLRVFDFGLGSTSDLASLGRTLRALLTSPECEGDGWRRDDVPDEVWSVALRAMGDGEPFADVTAVLEALDAAWKCPVRGPAERVVRVVAPAPQPEAPAPQPEAPAPQPEALAPQPEAPTPPPAPPASRAAMIATAAVTGALLAALFTLALRAALL